MIIGISGKAGAGKDEVAKILTSKFNFKRIAFADKLKEVCSEMFDLPLNMFHRNEFKDLVFETPEVIDVARIKNLVTQLEEYTSISDESYKALIQHGCGKLLYTPREILQFVGTDLCRSHVKDSIWIDIFNSIVKDTEGHIIVPDARFFNERKILKEIGGTTMLVVRPTINSTDAHISENQLGSPEDYDIVVTNDDTLAKLYHDIVEWYTLRTSR